MKGYWTQNMGTKNNILNTANFISNMEIINVIREAKHAMDVSKYMLLFI